MTDKGLTVPPPPKIKPTEEQVTTAYGELQARYRRPSNRLSLRVYHPLDLGEQIAGHRFEPDSYNGRSRESAGRKVMDIAELKRVVARLVETDQFVALTGGEAKDLGFVSYNLVERATYYVSTADFLAQSAETRRRNRENQRAKLRQQAREQILAVYAAQVQQTYEALCHLAELEPEPESPVDD